MRRRRHLVTDDPSLQDIWPSFTDVISTVALILFVVVLLAYVRNLVSSKQLNAYAEQIASSEKRLGALSIDLARTNRQISIGQAQLSASQLKLEEQQGIIIQSTSELDNLRARLSSIALLRVEVLNKVKQSIEAVLGGTNAAGAQLVHIGDNGNIVINEGVVFEFNSFAIKPEGTPLLRTLATALENVLGDLAVREYVDAIVVQGHTDDRGSGAFNRDLSANRANAVLDFMFEANPNLEQSYGNYFAASAYSEFRPLDSAATEAAYEKNRRIEISVALKDANVRKLIDQYIQDVEPPAAAPAVAQPSAPGAP